MKQFEGYTLAKISKNDAEAIHDLMIANAKRFNLYFPKTLEQNLTLTLAKEFASRKRDEFAAKEEFLFIIRDIQVDRPIGLIYIKELDWAKKQGEYAYCMDKSYGGKGIMSKAINELSKYAFENLGLEVLQIKVHKTNTASVKVAKNAHFIWQKTLLKEYTPPNGQPLDMELYELYKLPTTNYNEG